MTQDVPRRRFVRRPHPPAPPSTRLRTGSPLTERARRSPEGEGAARAPGATPAPQLELDSAVTVGFITAPHGIKGEVKVEVHSDFPERFERGAVVWIGDKPLRVEKGRWQGRSVVVKLEGVDDRAASEALRGSELRAPAMQELAEGTYYRDDLIGFSVVDSRGDNLGTLADIFATGSNDVYVVRSSRGELLLPATDDVITSVDLAGRVMVVEVTQGLEWVAGRSNKQRAVGNEGRKAGKGNRGKAPTA